MSRDLHPYDGSEFRFSHDDAEPQEGLDIVRRVLHLDAPPSPVDGVRYDLSFYSGGTGIRDSLAIALPRARFEVTAIVSRLGYVAPHDALRDEAWGDDFRWLLDLDESPLSLEEAVLRFVNAQRAPFQSPCLRSSDVWFEPCSTVNGWAAIWVADGWINMRGFEQG